MSRQSAVSKLRCLPLRPCLCPCISHVRARPLPLIAFFLLISLPSFPTRRSSDLLLLATLLVAALGPRPAPPSRAGLRAAALGFVTVLLGALTANTGASSACFGFPLCNGQLVPDGTYLQYIHWTHRLLAYALFGYTLWWARRTRQRAAWSVLGLVILQIAVAAAMVLLALPAPLQALHVAIRAAVWAGSVVAAV